MSHKYSTNLLINTLQVLQLRWPCSVVLVRNEHNGNSCSNNCSFASHSCRSHSCYCNLSSSWIRIHGASAGTDIEWCYVPYHVDLSQPVDVLNKYICSYQYSTCVLLQYPTYTLSLPVPIHTYLYHYSTWTFTSTIDLCFYTWILPLHLRNYQHGHGRLCGGLLPAGCSENWCTSTSLMQRTSLATETPSRRISVA